MPIREDVLQLITNASTQPLTNNMGSSVNNTSYGQGRILTWNAATFENTIAYRGGVLTNVLVLSGPDALTYQPDDIVAIISSIPNGGAAVYWIGGRIIVPGPGKGAEAIAFLASELGSALSAAVFNDRITVDEKPFQVTTGGVINTWVDGDFAGSPDPGPTCDIEVSEAGTAIVFISAKVSSALAAINDMSFLTTGSTDRSETSQNEATLRLSGGATDSMRSTVSSVSVMTGLNSGPHRLRMKYQTTDATAGRSSWSDRTMFVIAL